MLKLKTEKILKYAVVRNPIEDCIRAIVSEILSTKSPIYLACANPHSIVVSSADAIFEDALKASDILVPDGVGIIIASKFFGGGIRQRITGSDIFYYLHGELERRKGFSVFFLGSTQQTLDKIVTNMANDYPNIRIAGTYSPPYKPEFSDEDNQQMIAAINSARPDVLWVGMTAPKQEKWVYQHRKELDVKFIGAIGAVFDFYTGNVKRSHPFFQGLGLEWLPRLLQEPRRLWRRNFISGPLFLFKVVQSKIQRLLGD